MYGEPTLIRRTVMVIMMVGVVVVGACKAAPSRSGGWDASRSSGGAEGEHCAGMFCIL